MSTFEDNNDMTTQLLSVDRSASHNDASMWLIILLSIVATLTLSSPGWWTLMEVRRNLVNAFGGKARSMALTNINTNMEDSNTNTQIRI